MIDIANSTLVVAVDGYITTRSSSWTSRSTLCISADLHVPGYCNYIYEMLYIPSIDAYLIGTILCNVPILAASNFAQISNPTWSSSCYNYPSRQHQRQAPHALYTSTANHSADLRPDDLDIRHQTPSIPDLILSTYG